MPVSTSRRSSGTFEIPMFTSPLPRGASRALVISWKRVVFPLEGKPMRAARSMGSDPMIRGDSWGLTLPSNTEQAAKVRRNSRSVSGLRLTTLL
jgi:hypothetical protein